jgi:Zn-dependent oligopeptidase
MIRTSIRRHAARHCVRSLASLGSTSSFSSVATTNRQFPSSKSSSSPLVRAGGGLQQQRRSFLFDIFSGKNPILELTKNPSESVDFTNVSPNQLIKAATAVEAEYQAAVESLSIEGLSAEELLEKLQALETPPRTLRSLAVLMYQMHVFDKSWIHATTQVPTQFAHEESLEVLNALQATSSRNETTTRLIELQVQKYKKRGVELENREEKWGVLANASVQLEARFLTAEAASDPSAKSKPSTTKEQLQDLYTLLSVKQKQAELLGYKDYVEMSLDGRMMQREAIEPLLEEVAVRAQTAMDKANDDGEMSNFAEDVDVTPYFSLDGTIQCMFAVCRALFGIVVKEDDKPKAWHQDVRLFHVSDADGESLGSFYLDAFKRPIKARTNFMGAMTLDTLYINTNVKPPVWDDMATQVELKDVVALFHEFGHVLQFLLATNGRRAGIEENDATLDVSEIVPHFMEHWVFEESILQTLAHWSGTTIPDEVIQQVQKQRRHSKIDESLRRVFLGRLELELFTPTRQDDESLVAMQRRLAEQYVSHDLLPKSDLSPMVQLVGANGTKPVAQYRYLVSELISADIFATFKEAGLSNREEVARLGEQFKDILLAPGVAVNGYDALKQMTKKDTISPEAYFDLYKL